MSDSSSHATSAPGALDRPVRLTAVVQPYAWGGFDFIADLVGLPRDGRTPIAELWVGAHPLAPARVAGLEPAPMLDRVIANAPESALGPAARRFGNRLPYLLKVLDVRTMLSIQAHPTRDRARAGFAREEAAGIRADAPNRNYRDDNHKPEAAVAITEFWMLHGFRPPEEIRTLLDARPSLRPLLEYLAVTESAAAQHDALRRLYEQVMTLPQSEIDGLLNPWLADLEAGHAAGLLEVGTPDFWAARASRDFPPRDGHWDRGILSVCLLNLVRLAPGEAVFVGPGLLHAHLAGICVEIMASSDNVLRGGLTSKHVDVPELLAILDFHPGRPELIAARTVSPFERDYPVTADEFALTRLDLSPGATLVRRPLDGPDTLLVLEGALELRGDGEPLLFSRGGAAFVPAGIEYTVLSRDGAVAFRASVPRPA